MTKKNIFVSVACCLIAVGGFFLAMHANAEKKILGLAKNESKAIEIYSEQKKDEVQKVLADSITEISSERPVDVNNLSENIKNNVTPSEDDARYPLHKNITSTLFWIGEKADDDNKHISNVPSAWDEKWVKHFGGVDNPKKRNGYTPSSFAPNENPFYFALPYNDLNDDGALKGDVKKIVPWAKDLSLNKEESICKNRWIQIIHDGKVAYAQWEDVGPFSEDDAAYVFGGAQPKSKTNDHAGLDLSPSANDYLGLEDIDVVDWRFVDAKDVPDGPWKKTVTISGVCWKNS